MGWEGGKKGNGMERKTKRKGKERKKGNGKVSKLSEENNVGSSRKQRDNLKSWKR